MNRFAELLDRLAYEPRPQRQAAAADGLFPHHAGSGARLGAGRDGRRHWRFANAKPGLIRALDRRAHGSGAVRPLLRLCRRPRRDRGAALAAPEPRRERTRRPRRGRSRRCRRATAQTICRACSPRWLDALDETGRWALLKLITGGLRIGVSARLAKSAVAELGELEPDEIEEVWHGLEPPYEALFAWAEGRGRKPEAATPRRSARRCCRTPSRTSDFDKLDPADYAGRMEMGRHPRAGRRRPQAGRAARGAALLAHRRGHLRAASPTWSRPSISTARSTASCWCCARGACSPSTCCSSGSTARA